MQYYALPIGSDEMRDNFVEPTSGHSNHGAMGMERSQ